MVSVIGAPFDEFSSFMRGPAQAPDVIRQAYHTQASNYYTEQQTNLDAHPGWKDAGNLILPDGVKAIFAIEEGISALLKADHKVFTLGGDHAITYPVVRAFNKRHGALTILHLDAHGDLYDEFDGNRYSHACPFARIMEEGLASRLVQVGIRTMTDHQREQAGRFGVEVIEMKHWNRNLQFNLQGPVYVSLDMDAIDPAFAPGVSHHEPGGFTSREMLHLLQNIQGNVVGADLVEFNPARDASGITAMLTAKLFKEMLELLMRSH